MPTRVRFYVLLLRALLVLVPVAAIVLFAFSGRIAGALPQAWWAVAALLAVFIALMIWVGATTEARERDPLVRAFVRLVAAARKGQRG